VPGRNNVQSRKEVEVEVEVEVVEAAAVEVEVALEAAAENEGIHPVSTHPSVLEGLVDGPHIRWGLRVLKAVVSACLLDGYSADRLGS